MLTCAYLRPLRPAATALCRARFYQRLHLLPCCAQQAHLHASATLRKKKANSPDPPKKERSMKETPEDDGEKQDGSQDAGSDSFAWSEMMPGNEEAKRPIATTSLENPVRKTTSTRKKKPSKSKEKSAERAEERASQVQQRREERRQRQLREKEKAAETAKPKAKRANRRQKVEEVEEKAENKKTVRKVKSGPRDSPTGKAALSIKAAMLPEFSDKSTDVFSRQLEKVVRKKSSAVIHTVSADDLSFTPLKIEQPPVPGLSYGLDRVLFNPGVYHLQDERSRVYNFDPYLQKIMPVNEFDFNALKRYITSSQDRTLSAMAKKHGRKYVGSTSSMTAVLAHFHYLLSQWRGINTGVLSKGFPANYTSFTKINRAPVAIFLRWKNGTYAIDADKQYDSANILSMLGKSMEKLLTLPTDKFERYRRTSQETVSEAERSDPEAYQYSTLGDFMMRSQLDAYDPRLPGTGMFDLKTRAVVSIRHDVHRHEINSGYQIRHNRGEWNSYEREYYDMMRSTLLKYSLQARMGNMDGIFVAFHNVERIFGFQYVSIPEMDRALHQAEGGRHLGDMEFKFSLKLLNEVLEKATQKFPETSIRLHFETRETNANFMYIFARPVTEEEADSIQNSNKEKTEEFERKALGLNKSDTEDMSPEWEIIREEVKQEMVRDENGDDKAVEESQIGQNTETPIEKDNAAIEDDSVEEDDVGEDEAAIEDDSVEEDDVGEDDAVEKVNVVEEEETTEEDQAAETEERRDVSLSSTSDSAPPLGEESAETSRAEDKVNGKADPGEPVREEGYEGPLLGMTLTIRNKVNGTFIKTPPDLGPDMKWQVEYLLEEIEEHAKPHLIYQALLKRRSSALKKHVNGMEDEDESEQALSFYQAQLREMSVEGRKWRQEQDKKYESEEPVVFQPMEQTNVTVSANAKSNSTDVDSYLGWLYQATASLESAAEEDASNDTQGSEEVKDYMSWLYSDKAK